MRTHAGRPELSNRRSRACRERRTASPAERVLHLMTPDQAQLGPAVHEDEQFVAQQQPPDAVPPLQRGTAYPAGDSLITHSDQASQTTRTRELDLAMIDDVALGEALRQNVRSGRQVAERPRRGG